MGSQKIPILLYLLAAVLGAFGQYYYKKGGQILAETGSFLNIPNVVGVVLFCLVMVLFIVSYKMGGQISVVYPFYATTFAWGVAIGYFLEKESVKASSLVGLAFVMVGVCLMAWSSKPG